MTSISRENDSSVETSAVIVDLTDTSVQELFSRNTANLAIERARASVVRQLQTGVPSAAFSN